MLDLFKAAVSGDHDALGGLAALISIIAIIPAAVIFMINQVLHNSQLRDDKYRYLNDKYTEYLALALTYPKFDLEHGGELDVDGLEKGERCQLFLLYEVYSAMIEAAFRAYRHSWTSSRRTQWRGWVDYIDRYMSRVDYRSFLSSVLFRTDVEGALRAKDTARIVGLSEYDTEFERFLLGRYMHFLSRAAATGQQKDCDDHRLGR